MPVIRLIIFLAFFSVSWGLFPPVKLTAEGPVIYVAIGRCSLFKWDTFELMLAVTPGDGSSLEKDKKLENWNFLMQHDLSFWNSSKLNANSESNSDSLTYFQIGTLGIMWVSHAILNWACQCSSSDCESFFSKYIRKYEETEKWSAAQKAWKVLSWNMAQLWLQSHLLLL